MAIEHRNTRSAKEDRKWYVPLYDELISRALAQNNKTDALAWINAANGVVDNNTMKYMISPITNAENSNKIGDLPGEVRDTGIINLVRERNLGEYIGLGYDFTVVVHNSDSVFKRDIKIAEEVASIMEQEVINLVNEEFAKRKEAGENGFETGVPSKEMPDIEQFVKNSVEDWIDDRAIQGFNTLQLINSANDFENKRLQAFFYWWACEEFYTYRDVINNEVYTEVVSPLEGFPITNGAQFIEDEDGFVIKKITSMTELKSRIYETLDAEEKKYLDAYRRSSETGHYTVLGTIIGERWMSLYGNNPYPAANPHTVATSDEQVTEYTILFRTQVPYKIRTYINSFGEEHNDIVDQGYVKSEFDITVETVWVEEVWVGKRYGDKGTGIYSKPTPIATQRYDRHKMRPKLPVGGKKGILTGIKQNPIPNRLIEYTIIDRILNLQIERTLAKYKNNLLIMPQSLLNDDDTGSKNEKMFYMKADDMLVYDDSTIDINTVTQGVLVKDFPGLAEYLRILIDIREMYKKEALELANMNSYRLGDVMASTGKGVMQESIARAAVGNVLQITMFNAALERDHMADLEFSKVAYAEGKEGTYVDNQTGRVIPVSIDPIKHIETDYGIFVRNAKVDEEVISQYRQFAAAAAPAGEFELAVAALESKNVPAIRKAMKQILKANKDFQTQLETSKNNAIIQAEQIKSDIVDKQIERDVTIANIKADASITAAAISSSARGENDTQDTTDISNITNLISDSREARKQAMNEALTNAKIRQGDRQLDLKAQEIASKERIAKENKNKYDSPKKAKKK
jgi:hypothetical protein